MDILERVQWKAKKIIEELGHYCDEDRLRATTVQTGEEEAQEGSYQSLLISEGRVQRVRIFPGCPVTAQEVPSEHQEHFRALQVTEHWYRMPREAVDSPSLEMSTWNMTWSWATCSIGPCSKDGAEQDGLHRSPPTSNILWWKTGLSLLNSQNFTEL